ncbi:MAG: tail fiber domain-containing protein [Patescibacteria group bacterium]|nr:tail fiber domain-containing protein [Patescibacteria group bacterium]
MAVTANSLTTGTALKVTSSNNSASATGWSSDQLNITNAQGTTANTSYGFDIQYTQAPTVAGNTESVANFAIAANAGSPADVAVNTIINIANNDTATGNQITATNGLLVNGANVTNGINLSGTFGTNLITSTNFGVSQGGTITSAALTASQAVFTDGSKNLVSTGNSAALLNGLSDETGTGVAVFGTSPTLTTSLLTGSASFDLLNTNATTINFGGAATNLNVGPAGAAAATIAIAGGSAATGCTIDGATGNLTCSGAITSTSTTATQGYFSRSGTTLQPATAGDSITTSGNLSTSGTGTITSAALLTGSAGLTVSGAATTISGGAVNINNNSSFAVNVGTGTTTGGVSVGNTTAAQTVLIQGGTSATAVSIQTGAAGTLSLGNNGVASTIQVGNTTGAVAQTINIGNNATAASSTAVVIGSTIAGNITLQSAATINIGQNAAAQTLNIGNVTGATGIVERVGTGNYSLDGVTNSTYAIGASTTTGTITVGGTAQTGALTLGSSSGTNSVLIGNGAGATTVSIANTAATATGHTVNIAGSATATTFTDTVNIATGNTVGTGSKVVHIADGTPAGTNVVTIGSIAATANTTTIQGGNGAGAVSIQSATSGTISIASSGVANTLQLGNTTGAVAQTINIGNNATASSTSNVTIGSTIAGTTTLQNAATINLNAGTVVGNATTQNLFNATATTINFGGAAAALNIGPAAGAAATIAIAGGSGATGCTIDGATGNLTCSGNIIGNATGTDGYFSRAGTTIQPATAGDNITTSGAITTSGTGVITSAGLLTGSAGLTVSGAATTISGGVVNINNNSSFAVNVGTGTTTGGVSVGNTTAAQTVLIQGGTSATAVSIQTGSAGTLSLGNNGVASTIQIGNTTGAVAQTINIGNNATAASSTTVVIGSTIAGAVTLQSASSIGLNAPTIDSNAATVALLGTPTTINLGAAAATFNIGPTGATATTVNIAGGSAATGCSVDGATGGFSCTGNITGNATGTVGYFSRAGTTISTATAGDNITTSGNISTSGTGTITSAGLLTGSAGLTASGAAINLNASSSFAVNVGTGTTTGGVNIGNTTAGQTVLIQGGTGASAVSIQAGSAGTISVGSAAASTINLGTGAFAHTIAIGNDATTVQGITIGSANTTSATTILGGTGNINISPSGASNTGVIVKPAANSTSAFQIQNAAGISLLNVDTTSNKLTVSQGNLVITGLAVPTTPGVAAGANTGGTLSGAGVTTYYYKVSAINATGETLASTEVSINGQSFTKLTAPTAPSVALGAAGVLTGAYTYKVTFVTANGETTGGTTSGSVSPSAQQVNLTAIPVGATGTTQRKIYRTAAGGVDGTQKLLTTIADNTTTIYTDNTADGSLGAVLPGSNTATTNTNNATVSFTGVTGATSYRVYRGTAAGGENVYQTTASSPFTDTGAAGTGATPPASDATARVGIGTSAPSASLHVAGTALLQNASNSTTAFQVQNAAGTNLFSIDTTNTRIALGGSSVANATATGTTGTSSGTGNTNTTTIILAAAGAFANNDIIFVDNTGGNAQDYFTRIASGGGTTTLTTSTPVSYGTVAGYTGNATITKYTAQYIGNDGTNFAAGATRSQNAFYEGYFSGSVVVGTGSTTLSDGSLNSSTYLALGTANTERLRVDASGNVGIGTTIPSSQLHVKYTAANASAAAPVLILDNPSGGTSTVQSFRLNNSEVGRLRTDSSGNFVVDGTGAGATYLNYDSGTGGTYFGNGASATTASISASGSMSLQGGSLTFTNGTANDIYFGIAGVAAPGAGSAGQRLSLYGTAGTVGSGDYALGIESGNMWLNSGGGFKFYTNSVLKAVIDSNASFSLNSKEVVNSSDSYLRLNNSGNFTSGVYTPGALRADGLLQAGGGTNGSLQIGSKTLSVSTASSFIESNASIRVGTGNRFTMTDSGNTNQWNLDDNGGSLRLFREDTSGANGAVRFSLADNGVANFPNILTLGTNAGCLYNLCIFGNQYSTSSSTFSVPSDMNYKKNITTIADPLGQIDRLRAVTFNWRTDEFPNMGWDNKINRGFIAQEIQQVFPDMVTTDPTGHLMVNYGGLISPTIGAIQQLSHNVTDLQSGTMAFSALNVSGTAVTNDLTVKGVTNTATLQVTGSANIEGTLKVTGLVSVVDLKISGHIVTAGDALSTQAMAALGGLGAAVTVDGNDTAGTVTLRTGTDGVVAGELGKVSFKKAFGKTPRIVLSAQDDASDQARIFPSSKTATDFMLKTVNNLSPNTTYTFDYIIVE